MPRAIYTKEIYKREQQTTRKVYQRKNNVIPVKSGNYIVSNVILTSAGHDYLVDDVLTIEGSEGDTPATITVLTVKPDTYSVSSATAAGTMSGYESGETITILGSEGDVAAVLTITAEAGSITSLAVTEAGSYSTDISGEVSTYSYEGVGTGLELTVVASKDSESGAILTFEFTEGLYASDLSGSKSLDSITGAGAVFNVTMEPEIVGDDEDIPSDAE